MDEKMRAVLAPALEQFKRLVASKRSRGETDEDLSQTLSELEASMRDIGIMSDAQITDSMQIYHHALQEEAITHDARKQADAILGTLFDLIRDGMAEERKKGTSETEIQQKLDDVCRTIEQAQRGRVPDRCRRRNDPDDKRSCDACRSGQGFSWPLTEGPKAVSPGRKTSLRRFATRGRRKASGVRRVPYSSWSCHSYRL
jgi:hypothetical protein